MRYVSAYMLAVAGGNPSPKLEDIKNILGAVGVDTDAEAAKLVISRLQGKNIEEVIAEGSAGLVSVSCAFFTVLFVRVCWFGALDPLP
ncbi:unnamed protein product [Haemonchus placei]|uniref:Large ribosomal subunit protein P2 n=1 Tax=Haemonchus placei TaxID=6290 RepID=A0A0N4VYA0_HAEPC|nr:unnamed protein product [Haemonchus placei]